MRSHFKQSMFTPADTYSPEAFIRGIIVNQIHIPCFDVVAFPLGRLGLTPTPTPSLKLLLLSCEGLLVCVGAVCVCEGAGD